MNNQVPFIIMPTIGYLNTQFQIIPKSDELKTIIIESENQRFNSIKVESYNPITLYKLKNPGIYIIKTTINNIKYQKEITILDSIKLGNSILKSAYTFDGIDYAIFLMKDRIVFYSEKSKTIFYENNISPTSIIKKDDQTLIFITRFSNENLTITNYAFYSLNSFDIIWEINNGFKELFFDEKAGVIWVDDFQNKYIIGYKFLGV